MDATEHSVATCDYAGCPNPATHIWRNGEDMYCKGCYDGFIRVEQYAQRISNLKQFKESK